MTRTRTVSGIAALAAAIAAFAVVAPDGQHAAGAQARGWIDTSNRAAVATAYLNTFGPAVPAHDWNGSVAGCQAGTISAAYRTAMMNRVNWYRAMSGVLDGVVEDATLTSGAQKAALIMAANDNLSHDPPSSWACWTQEGRDGAAKSNLYWGTQGFVTGVGAIDGWIQDSGSGNERVGHRTLMLDPGQSKMGPGFIPDESAALYVLDPSIFTAAATRDPNKFVSWPPPGFVPSNKVYPRFSLQNQAAGFTGATVSVTVNGSPVSTTVEHRGAEAPSIRPAPVITFVPSLPAFPASSDMVVGVTVSGITGSGVPSSYSWTTTIIPPPTSVPTTIKAVADFDGDSKTDISVYRPSGNAWFARPSSGGADAVVNYGAANDVPVPGDYDGDNKKDQAIFRPSTGLWAIHRSTGGDTFVTFGGVSGDIPVAADYDGDGKADVAIYRPSTGTWYVNNSAGGTSIVTFGISGDVPVPADYDGDGKADRAVFRPGGAWHVNQSSGGTTSANYGAVNDVPVPGDYDGDGKTDKAIFRPSTGLWAIARSTGGDTFLTYGISTDKPQPGDYDGDAKTDVGVFRPSSAAWYVRRSTTGVDAITTFGIASDVALPLPTPVRLAFYP